jgi:hypothetical protein
VPEPEQGGSADQDPQRTPKDKERADAAAEEGARFA